MYAVEPENSAVIAGKPPGEHMLQGIGDGFVPDNLDKKLLTAAIPVSDRDALKMTRRLASEEGLLVGVSSGASVVAAVQVGKNWVKVKGFLQSCLIPEKDISVRQFLIFSLTQSFIYIKFYGLLT